jgi:hypothetical protein
VSATYLGELSIGDALPGANGVAVAGATGINSALPDILARIAALQAFVPLPTSFVEQLATAESIVASVQAGIELGLPVPSLDAQIAQMAALVASLLAQVEAINAQLTLVASFRALLGEAGIHAIAFAGLVGSFGGDVDGALASVGALVPGESANAVVLLTTSPAAWSALSQIAKVTP